MGTLAGGAFSTIFLKEAPVEEAERLLEELLNEVEAAWRMGRGVSATLTVAYAGGKAFATLECERLNHRELHALVYEGEHCSVTLEAPHPRGSHSKRRARPPAPS